MYPGVRHGGTLTATTPRDLLIAGEWCPAADLRRFTVNDPATGEDVAEVASATPADGMRALAAASGAQHAWAKTSPARRAETLRAIYAALIDRADDFAFLLTTETGRPLAESQGEVALAADYLRWYAGLAVRIEGGYLASPDGRGRMLTTPRPVGPCLAITPWSFPLATAARKVAPALAAGNACLLKPSRLAPLTALAFVALCAEAGLPPGVVGAVPTDRPGDLVAPLLADNRLRLVTLTGSTQVGRSVQAAASDQILRTSLELSGNAPFVVFPDADLDLAVAGAIVAKTRAAGQWCMAANRFYVHRSVLAAFAGRLSEAFARLQVGKGFDPLTEMGPLINPAACQRVRGLVEAAVGEGARVLTGGSPESGPGSFFPPTVLVDVSPQSTIMRSEIFGPVAPIASFTTEDEAIALANDCPVGLGAFAFTTDLGRVVRLSESLDVGMLAINRGIVSNAAAPFGGIKQSGDGRSGGQEGIEPYLTTTYVALPDPR